MNQDALDNAKSSLEQFGDAAPTNEVTIKAYVVNAKEQFSVKGEAGPTRL